MGLSSRGALDKSNNTLFLEQLLEEIMVFQNLISIPCNNGLVEMLLVLCFAHSIAPLPDFIGEITSDSPGASAETAEQNIGHNQGVAIASPKAKSRLINGPCGFHTVDLDYLPQVLIIELPVGTDGDVTIHSLDDEEIIIVRHVRPSLSVRIVNTQTFWVDESSFSERKSDIYINYWRKSQDSGVLSSLLPLKIARLI